MIGRKKPGLRPQPLVGIREGGRTFLYPAATAERIARESGATMLTPQGDVAEVGAP